MRRTIDRVARPLDHVAEHVETYADIAYAAGANALAESPHARFRDAGLRAERLRDRQHSANTPAAVTSGPAPGPCTISGLSQ